jgi:putative transposase
MPNFRRNWVPGGTFFFTIVTAERAPLFRDESAQTLLGRSFRQERAIRPFSNLAMVLLPDHFHALWELPPGDCDFSTRWSSIKARFTREWLAKGGAERPVPQGQKRQERRGIWQARFFEHTIRDEDDLIQHADDIHFNPVKHRLVTCPRDWRWSSFARFVQQGHYPDNWACSQLDQPPQFPRIDCDLVE